MKPSSRYILQRRIDGRFFCNDPSDPSGNSWHDLPSVAHRWVHQESANAAARRWHAATGEQLSVCHCLVGSNHFSITVHRHDKRSS